MRGENTQHVFPIYALTVSSVAIFFTVTHWCQVWVYFFEKMALSYCSEKKAVVYCD